MLSVDQFDIVTPLVCFLIRFSVKNTKLSFGILILTFFYVDFLDSLLALGRPLVVAQLADVPHNHRHQGDLPEEGFQMKVLAVSSNKQRR